MNCDCIFYLTFEYEASVLMVSVHLYLFLNFDEINITCVPNIATKNLFALSYTYDRLF